MKLQILDAQVFDEGVTRTSPDVSIRTSMSIDRELDLDGLTVLLSWHVAFEWTAERTPSETFTVTATVGVTDPAGEDVATGSHRFRVEDDSGRVEVPFSPFTATVTGTHIVRLTVEGVAPIDVPVSLVVTA